MKSTAASQRTLAHLLTGAQLVLLEARPGAVRPTPADYDGSRPVALGKIAFSGNRASNADQIDLPRNTGRTTARVSAWAIIDADGAWLYAQDFATAFDVRPGDEPYLTAGDLVIED